MDKRIPHLVSYHEKMNSEYTQPPWLEPRTAYVHIPFCAHQCGYCDFAVSAGDETAIPLYLEALATELATLHTPRTIETLFLGGGTPSHLNVEQLSQLFDSLERWFELPTLEAKHIPQLLDLSGVRLQSPHPPRSAAASPQRGEAESLAGVTLSHTHQSRPPLPAGGRPPAVAKRPRREGGFVLGYESDELPRREFSFEANPDSLDAEKVELLAARGVTRLSLGVQSFQPDLLTALERRHTQADIGRAVELAQRHGMSVSLDLIFAAPGATPAMWEADLQSALALQPDHISTYGLTYEKGTRLWKHRERGMVPAVPEADELRMYETAIDTLTGAGFEHYEVSNFAKPGQRCRHNERYWANHAYFGFGVGAAAYVQGTRTLNVRNTRDYIRKVFAGEPVAFQSEHLNDADRAVETMAVHLRRCEGIDRVAFEDQTGLPLDPLVAHRLPMMLGEGLLEDTGTAIRLTRKGRCVADGIIESLMAK